MRGAIEGLTTPHPLGETLPALFQEQDSFALAFTSALDEVLAPVFLALDCMDAYLDPELAPVDFLDWLASWVGVELDETRPVSEQRETLKRSVQLFAWRGTKRGLSDAIYLYTGADPEIIDSGGASSSEGPDGPLPGSPVPSLHVRVHVAEGREVSEARLHEIVRMAKPAHLPHTIEVVGAEPEPAPTPTSAMAAAPPVAPDAPDAPEAPTAPPPEVPETPTEPPATA